MTKKESRAVATIDIPGAYLNADMPKGEGTILVRTRFVISNILIQLDSSAVPFLNDDETIVVELDKALYELVESALLWYQLLCKRLMKIEYTMNPYDRCVFNKSERDNSQSTVCFHVDDLMITAQTEDHVTYILEEFRRVFGDITVNRGHVHDYLGMVFDFSNDIYLNY